MLQFPHLCIMGIKIISSFFFLEAKLFHKIFKTLCPTPTMCWRVSDKAVVSGSRAVWCSMFSGICVISLTKFEWSGVISLCLLFLSVSDFFKILGHSSMGFAVHLISVCLSFSWQRCVYFFIASGWSDLASLLFLVFKKLGLIFFLRYKF